MPPNVRRQGGTNLSQYRVEDIKVRVEIDAIGSLQALGLVAFLLLHEYVQLYDDIAHTLCDFPEKSWSVISGLSSVENVALFSPCMSKQFVSCGFFEFAFALDNSQLRFN